MNILDFDALASTGLELLFPKPIIVHEYLICVLFGHKIRIFSKSKNDEIIIYFNSECS